MIDVVPTADMWASLTGTGGVFAFHLYLLAHPTDLSGCMISVNPEVFFGHFLDTWAPEAGTNPADVQAAYLTADRRAVTDAMCQDYRASAFVHAGDDKADRAAGRRIDVPALAGSWQSPTADRPARGVAELASDLRLS